MIALPDTKHCSRCERTKPMSDFQKNRKRKDGLQTYCKACCKDIYESTGQGQIRRDRAKKWYAENPERRRNTRYLQMFGITLDDYNRMLEEQGGVCVICGTDTPIGVGKHFSVDHCHTTGDVRGLLCTNCNTGIGLFKDDPATLKSAIKYLSDRNA